MRRSVVLVGVWITGTAIGMVLAAFAVQLASAKVTDHPTAIVSRPQIDQELTNARASSTTEPSTTTTTTTEVGPTVDDTQPPDDPATKDPAASLPVTTAPKPGAGTKTTTTRPPVTSPPATQPRPPTTSKPPTTAPPPTLPPPTTTTTVAPDEKQFTTIGGWVRVKCQGAVASLVGASPSSGYTMQVKAQGPAAVQVYFIGPHHSSGVYANCQAGKVVGQVKEQPA